MKKPKFLELFKKKPKFPELFKNKSKFLELFGTVSKFMWGNSLKVIGTTGIISLAVGYISQCSSIILGAWMAIAIMALAALYYSEKQVQALEKANKE